MDDTSWQSRIERARAELAPLHFLLGEWIGTGTILGDPVTAQLHVKTSVDGTWLEARETVVDANGEPVHEDISFYRFDAEVGGLRVLHLTAGAYMEELQVLFEDGGVHWLTGLGGPQLWIRAQDEGFNMTVQLPDAEALSVDMRYRPA